MSVDPDLPMELDNGRPVRLIMTQGEDIQVQIEGSPWRNERNADFRHDWWYSKKTGVFLGGTRERTFVLRNVETIPVIESWRL